MLFVRIIVPIFISLQISSCAYLKSDSDKMEIISPMEIKNQLSKEIKAICFSGEGRGQFKDFSNKYLFQYETLLKLEQSTWSVAVNIPMHGEEILNLHWDGKQSASGSLYKQSSSKFKKESLKQFLDKIVFFLKFSSDLLQDNNNKYLCKQNLNSKDFNGFCQKDDKNKLLWKMGDGEFEMSSILGDMKTIKMRAYSKAHGSYYKTSFMLIDNSTLIQLNLFATDCQ